MRVRSLKRLQYKFNLIDADQVFDLDDPSDFVGAVYRERNGRQRLVFPPAMQEVSKDTPLGRWQFKEKYVEAPKTFKTAHQAFESIAKDKELVEEPVADLRREDEVARVAGLSSEPNKEEVKEAPEVVKEKKKK